MPNAPTNTEAHSFTQLVDKLVDLTLHQCKVYAARVPNAIVTHRVEPTLHDKENTLRYAVIKRLYEKQA